VRRRDRLIGIALGILLGLAIVAAFVFLGSEEAIDDPSLSGETTERSASPRPAEGARPPGPAEATP